MKVIIVCHAEFGHANGKKIVFYDYDTKKANEGVENSLDVIERNNAKICFALTPGVAECLNNRVRERLKSKNVEIGLHIHPDHRMLINRGISDNRSRALRDYSLEEQKMMMKFGMGIIKHKFNLKPKVFVAGRWSENNDTIKALAQLGFEYDCSPDPNFTSVDCNWSRLPRISMPYNPSVQDYQKSGSLPVLMVPISKTLTNAGASPESAPGIGLGFLKACFREYHSQNLPVFHICFHSPSMTSKYYIDVFDKFLKFISGHKNVEFSFASGLQACDAVGRKKIYPYLRRINRNILAYALFRRV